MSLITLKEKIENVIPTASIDQIRQIIQIFKDEYTIGINEQLKNKK